MKITSVRTMRLEGPDPLAYTVDGTRSVLLVRVDTDEGVWGLGEATDWPGVRGLLHDYGTWLVGRDPLQVNDFVHTMLYGGLPPFKPEQSATVLHTGPVSWAVSAIEIALHDIAGKTMDVPIFVLLGGKFRDQQRLYLHCVSPGSATPNDHQPWVTAARAAVNSGYDFVKFDVEQAAAELTRDTRNRSPSPTQLAAIRDRFAAVREAIGPTVELAADGHMHYDIPSAISISRSISPSRLTWFEDPVPALNARALVEVRRASDIPICAGEMFTAEEVNHLIHLAACDFVHVDVLTVGGLRRAKTVSDLAFLDYLPVAIHNNWSMVGAVAAAHVAAACSNFVALELFQGFVESDLMTGLVDEGRDLICDGHLAIPAGPGLGIRLDEGVCGQFLAAGEELF